VSTSSGLLVRNRPHRQPGHDAHADWQRQRDGARAGLAEHAHHRFGAVHRRSNAVGAEDRQGRQHAQTLRTLEPGGQRCADE
jgi:hypothetical protein